jgi:hypothetical protein
MNDDNGDSNPVELGQNPSLKDSFEPISPAHERARHTIDETLDAFANGDDYQPPAIRGPFRTGKTALEYHSYKTAWEQDLPAVYVEAATLLEGFEDSSSDTLETWVLDRTREEIEAITSRDFDKVEWMPTGTESEAVRREWISENIPTDIESDRYVLIIDEVEPKYEDFLTAAGVDDDNPLRKLLDEPQLLPILSLGQLSAFEFIGDADLGRTEPVPIPPVTIDHVENLLEQQGSDPGLGRVIYWLTRGRAARVHQLVTDVEKRGLTPSDYAGVADWLSEQVHEQSTEFQPIRQIWEDPGIDDPEAAAGALAFDPDGYSDWLVASDTWCPADAVIGAIEDVLRETDPFTADTVNQSTRREARRILRQAVGWVVNAIAVPSHLVDGADDRAVPSNWLSSQAEDRDESDALLNLVQDFLLAFEADREARELAFNAMEAAKTSFKRQYDSQIASVAASKGDVWTVRLTTLEQAYPPLATDPSRLTQHSKSELQGEMTRGLEVSVEEPASVIACPTQDAFEGQLQALDPDLTHPTVILVDDDVDVDEGLSSTPLARTLAKHDVLTVESVSSARVWEFVVQLYGCLRQHGDPYTASEDRVAALVDAASNRENVTTIETLYDHLTTRVASEAAQRSVEAHREQFDAGGAPVWAHDDVAGEMWVNPGAEWSDGRFAVATLLALGAEPDWDDYGHLLNDVEDGLDADEIDTPSGKFKFKELLSNHINAGGGYGSNVKTPRRICRQDDDSGPTSVVTRVQGVFDAVIENSGHSRDDILRQLLESQGNPNGQSPTDAATDLLDSLAPIDKKDYTTDVLWALITATLVREDESFIVDRLDDIASDYTDLVRTLNGYENDVDEAEAVLAPEGVPTGRNPGDDLTELTEQLEQHVNGAAGSAGDTTDNEDSYGVGVELDASHIKTYRENLESIRDALRAAKSAAASSADARPTAYAVAVIASRYEHIVRDAVDELERATPSEAIVSNVQNLRSEVQQLLDDESDPDLSELSDEKVDAMQQYGDDLLDLEAVVNTNTIPVGNPEGEGVDLINEIDRTAEQRCRKVQQVQGDLARLVDLQQTGAMQCKNAHRQVRALTIMLDDPEAPIPTESQQDVADASADSRSEPTEDDTTPNSSPNQVPPQSEANDD